MGKKEFIQKMESAIQEVNGLGWCQMRAIILMALPLTAFPGFMQMQVFFGQVLPHECENDVNKTGAIIRKYIPSRGSTDHDTVSLVWSERLVEPCSKK